MHEPNWTKGFISIQQPKMHLEAHQLNEIQHQRSKNQREPKKPSNDSTNDSAHATPHTNCFNMTSNNILYLNNSFLNVLENANTHFDITNITNNVNIKDLEMKICLSLHKTS